jgi:hypothetical protein
VLFEAHLAFEVGEQRFDDQTDAGFGDLAGTPAALLAPSARATVRGPWTSPVSASAALGGPFAADINEVLDLSGFGAVGGVSSVLGAWLRKSSVRVDPAELDKLRQPVVAKTN